MIQIEHRRTVSILNKQVSWPTLAFLAVLSIYLISRLAAIENLPIFVDEAISINRAYLIQSGVVDPYTISVGKLLSELIYAVLMALPAEPLALTRFASVISGASTLVAIYYTGLLLLSQRAALLATLIYVLLPFTVFYNRLGLPDSILLGFGSWVILLSVKTALTPSPAKTLILIGLLIASFLAKFNGAVFLLIPPLALILVDLARLKASLRSVILAVFVSLIALLIAVWLGFGSFELSDKVSMTQSSTRQLDLIFNNIGLAAEWFWLMLTPPIAIFVALTLIWSLFRGDRRHWFFLLIIAIVLLPYIVIAGTWYPRYIILALFPIGLLSSLFLLHLLSWLREKTFSARNSGVTSVIMAFLLFCWPVIISLIVLFRPENAPLPEIVREQYIQGWPAGYSKPEAASYLADLAALEENAIQLVRLPKKDGIDLYLKEYGNINIALLGDSSLSGLMEYVAKVEPGRKIYFYLDTTRANEKAFRDDVLFKVSASQRVWQKSKPGTVEGIELWRVDRSDLSRSNG